MTTTQALNAGTNPSTKSVLPSIHLQGIGRVTAKPVSEVQVGETIYFNFGYGYEVTAIERVSPQFFMLTLVSKDNGNAYSQRYKASRLVAAR
jgi:hypothetical protein